MTQRFEIRRFALAAGTALMALAGAERASAQVAPAQASAPQAPVAANCAPLLNKTFLRLQDEKPQSLCQYSGKVLVVVNTASKCGFAGQFEGLEALYAKYKDQGLVVLGFPSADFMSQEYETGKQIADFCQKVCCINPVTPALFLAAAAVRNCVIVLVFAGSTPAIDCIFPVTATDA